MFGYLRKLKNDGFYPDKVLDIGANIGDFTKSYKSIWPNSHYILIEGNKNCEKYLKNLSVEYHIELVAEKVREVDFYLTKENNICTGNSIYLEKTKHYSKENLIVEKRTTNTLDNIITDKVDLIKMDTQGSELDIIKGGLNLIKSCKYILIEVSLIEYNYNAPLKEEICDFMTKIGFSLLDVVGKHIWPNDDGFIEKNKVFQEDLIFINE